DVSTGSGSPTFNATTLSGNTNGLFGIGPAFATFGGGATWAKVSGGKIVGLTAADYGATFTAGTNVDVATSSTQTGITANSLRFNIAGVTLTLSGTNTLQSGSILVTPNVLSGATIAGGGTLTAPSSGELLIHAYGALTINPSIVSTAGLTKSGTDFLI